jgi:hypothetical protein
MKIHRTALNVGSVAILFCALAAATAATAAGPTRLRAPRTYPLVINAPGSYVLTQSLVVPANTSAILITASDVTLDLGGFVISGPVVCDGDPTVCGPAGTGFGIYTSGAADNTTIRNGTVRGMGLDGVSIGAGIIENVRAVGNGGIGISASTCVIRDSIALSNGGDGISAFLCAVVNSVAARNGSTGIHAGGPILGNVASSNAIDGISSQGTPSGAAAIHDNVAVSNGHTGISGTFSSVVANVSYANGQYGVSGGSGLGFALNAASSNGLGASSGGYELGTNLCGLDITCP